MPFVACPCGKKFRAIDALAGKRVNCPGCGRPLLIPQASLLDEELDRQQRASPATAPVSRPRTHLRSTTIEGWLLLVLLAGGGAVVVAILMMFFSMLGGDDDRRPDLESKSPSGDAMPDSAAPPSDLVPAPNASDLALPHEIRQPPGEKPAPPPAESSREEPLPSKPARPSPGASSSGENTVRLSMGVALAQTLPTGTAMGFSVDYEFVNNPPSGPANLVWVVESGQGQVIKQPVQVSAGGTLQGFFPQFRPEHGPFSTHIEDQSGHRLSKSLSFR